MEEERNRIFREFCPCAEPGLVGYIEDFLKAEEAVVSYDARTDQEGKICLHATLVKFSFVAAKNVFLALSELVRRSGFNVYAGEELETQAKYLFVTGMSGIDGIKMEIVID